MKSRDLPTRAIDNAFIDHVGKLFETLNRGIKDEALESAEALRLSKLPSAIDRYAIDFQFARRTHDAMIKHLAFIQDSEL